MSYPFGSRSFSPRLAAPRPKPGPVLAVGSLATIENAAFGATARVALRDYADHATIGSVGEGAEVEVTAWQPHRSNGTRYRVRATSGDEGWLGAGQLKARPPRAVVRVAPVVPVPDAAARPARRARKAKPIAAAVVPSRPGSEDRR